MEQLQEYLGMPVVQKALRSVFLLLLFLILIFISRKSVNRFHTDREHKVQYRRWATYFLFFLYSLILVRVWAFANLFDYLDYFRLPLIVKLLKSAFALGLIYMIVFFARRFINSLNIEIEKRHQYRKRTSYIATLVYFVILIPIWAGNTQQWATVLSVLGAGLALALHEVILNIAGWFYVVLRHPYRTGDRIEIGSVRGDVIDVRLFQTMLLEIGNWVDGDQSTGRVVHFPHGQIFRQPLFNYTKGFEYLWNEFSTVITFESNWEKARTLMLQFGEEESREVQAKVQRQIDKMAREYLIYYRRFTPIVYVRIGDSGVKLTLRYLTDVKKRRSTEDAISRKCLKAFHQTPDIDFAYPTTRFTGIGGEPPLRSPGTPEA